MKSINLTIVAVIVIGLSVTNFTSLDNHVNNELSLSILKTRAQGEGCEWYDPCEDECYEGVCENTDLWLERDAGNCETTTCINLLVYVHCTTYFGTRIGGPDVCISGCDA